MEEWGGNSKSINVPVGKYVDMWYKYMDTRKQWYIDHIGINIYPSNPICPCAMCAKYYESGYVMESLDEADDMWGNEIAAHNEHFLRKWFDDKDERDRYVEDNKQNND